VGAAGLTCPAAAAGRHLVAGRRHPALPLSAMSAERRYVTENLDQLHADLDAWLRIPSISADPGHAADVRRSAEWLAAAFRRTGLPTVEIWDTPGAPSVFAEWPSDDPGAPRVLVYGHHDVQPVDPLELWQTPPFEPTVRGEDLFARGACDDKGQLLFHLLGLRAHLSATGRSAPAVHLMFLIEGEEESGSPHFEQLLRDRGDRLACDVVVVTDTGMFDRDVPSTCTAMRGLAACEIHFHGPDIDLHSGSFGGAVPNPVTALARLVAALHDADGVVQIPGFYDDVLPLTDAERALFGKLPFDEAAFLAGPAASRAVGGEIGYTTLERIWGRPTAEVNGMWGGYTGSGGKTIVPSDGYVKLSFRLVANQEPAAVREGLRRFVAGHTPAGIDAEVHWSGPGVRPCRTPLDHPAVQAVTAALGRAFEQQILFTREGGSGPEAYFTEVLGAPVVFLGVGLPGDQIHAPNERVTLPMLYRGAEAAAYLWSELPAALR
jgi:acetylornithine deacetylase/succinyl-diaminopimelate desuccinylase-like protein